MTRKNLLPLAILMVAIFVSGILFATTGANLLDMGDQVAADVHADPPEVLHESSLGARLELEETFINVAATINPAVVQIRAEQLVVNTRSVFPFRGTPFYDFFENLPEEYRGQFPQFSQPTPQTPQEPQPQLRQGLGSGAIIRPDGYIATNNHVIGNASSLKVKLYDGTIKEAQVVGRDPQSDLAVIKIEAEGLPTVPLGRMEDVRVGQWVLAFGSPFSESLDNSVTAGIVSAVGRTGAQLSSISPFSAFIQTDAAINRGNSGGPLVNLQGQLMGINSAILSPTGSNSGIGFAIPVSVVENVITQLIETGRVDRGFLGVQFSGVSMALAQALDVPHGAAQVSVVLPNSAADKSGIKEGDIIVEINGVELTDHEHLRTTIGNMKPNDEVQLGIVRDYERIDLSISLGRRDEDLAMTVPEEVDRELRGQLGELGLSVRNATQEALKEVFGDSELPEISGVLIDGVNEGSAAFGASDLRTNDVIVEIDRQTVSSVKELKRIYNDLEDGSTFLVKVLRSQRSREGEISFVPFLTALTKPE